MSKISRGIEDCLRAERRGEFAFASVNGENSVCKGAIIATSVLMVPSYLCEHASCTCICAKPALYIISVLSDIKIKASVTHVKRTRVDNDVSEKASLCARLIMRLLRTLN